MTTGRAFLDELDARRNEVALEVDRILGVGEIAAETAATPLDDALPADRAALGGVVRLCVLAATTALPILLFTSLLPRVSDSIGASRAALNGLALLTQVVLVLSAFALMARARRGRSARLAVVLGLVTAAATGLAGIAGTTGGLALALVVAAVGASAVRVLHPPMLVDGSAPAVRARVLSAHRAADSLGRVLALALAGGIGALGLTWRGGFFLAGAVAFLAVLFAARVPQPVAGGHDTEAVRDSLTDRSGQPNGKESAPIGWPEREGSARGGETRRALQRPTVRRVLGVWAALGALTLPLLAFVGFFLADRWHVHLAGRLGVLAVTTALTIPLLGLLGPRAEVAFADDPGSALRIVAGAAIASAVGLVVAVVSPLFFLSVIGLGVALAATSIAVPMLDLVGLSVVPSEARPTIAALAQGAFVGVGGIGAVIVFGGLDRRFGLAGSLASLIVPAVLVAALARRAAPGVRTDLERLGTDVVVDTELRRRAAAGKHVPLLVCRGIDFSYGPLQVLFGVDFTVDDGQLVALLGTNGAGKSTLLRVISGLGLPSAGSVHFQGEDITFLDAEDRLRLGIAEVPGGHAVFGPLTVAENLRVVGGAAGRSRADAESTIDEVFSTFPRLAERRSQPASTLSGGEQQMLGLSKALLLRPRILLVDELSLGLAPKVVGELLQLVRRINAEGTAVVLVEQSVNVALSLADHAYFMEKGEVRFDGPAGKLLDRGDLVRSVFLGGAVKRLDGAIRSATR
ncbi:MAG TPA: MFS transporter [Acidimicrobiales bacterium]|nr:MFS transporter [Acidimicrobiales bacterium]